LFGMERRQVDKDTGRQGTAEESPYSEEEEEQVMERLRELGYVA